MLDEKGNAKLIDFGVSTWKWLLYYEPCKVIGTPYYMAPEIFQNKYTMIYQENMMKKWTSMPSESAFINSFTKSYHTMAVPSTSIGIIL